MTHETLPRQLYRARRKILTWGYFVACGHFDVAVMLGGKRRLLQKAKGGHIPYELVKQMRAAFTTSRRSKTVRMAIIYCEGIYDVGAGAKCRMLCLN